MKQIYNFERKVPPILNENLLRAENERRKVQQITTLLAVSSLLIFLSILLLAIQLYDVAPLLSIACVSYICIAVTGSSVIAIVYAQKRRLFEKC